MITSEKPVSDQSQQTEREGFKSETQQLPSNPFYDKQHALPMEHSNTHYNTLPVGRQEAIRTTAKSCYPQRESTFGKQAIEVVVIWLVSGSRLPQSMGARIHHYNLSGYNAHLDPILSFCPRVSTNDI